MIQLTTNSNVQITNLLYIFEKKKKKMHIFSQKSFLAGEFTQINQTICLDCIYLGKKLNHKLDEIKILNFNIILGIQKIFI